MSGTPLSRENKDFTDAAHLAAREIIYPALFETDSWNIDYEVQEDIESARGGVLDGELAIDRVLSVSVPDLAVPLRAPLRITVQERFRRPQFQKWQDVTVTEWNLNTNLPSELYKLQAGLFVYGYYDKEKNAFLDVICVNVSSLLLAIAQRRITGTLQPNHRSNQVFRCFTFESLYKAGLVEWRFDPQAAYAGALRFGL